MELKCLNCIKQEAVRPTLEFLVAKSRRKVSLLASLVIENITVFFQISFVFKDLKISIIKNINNLHAFWLIHRKRGGF